MTTVNQAYINALLADASYAAVTQDMNMGRLQIELAERMTPPLAAYIAANFEVTSSVNSSDFPFIGSGFDAVVWRGKAGSEYDGMVFVSMRGTEVLPGADLLADTDLAITDGALAQIVDMVNWWLRETTPTVQQARQIKWDPLRQPIPGSVQVIPGFVDSTPAQGTANLTGVTSVSVNGHSLGGHLATAFARIFGGSVTINGISTFNSAGFNTQQAETVFRGIQNLLGTGLNTYSTAQTNYYAANGVEFTTNEWWFAQRGERVGVFQEDLAPVGINNHFMYKLTDVLALGAALEKLDPTFTVAKLNTIIEAGSNDMAGSYEGILDALLKILVAPSTAPIRVGDVSDSATSRVSYHEAIAALIKTPAYTSLAGKLIIKLSEAADLGAAARNSFAALISLKDLSPITLRGINSAADGVLNFFLQQSRAGDYAAWEADRSTRTPSTYTDQWIADRAALLQATVVRNQHDNTTGLIFSAAAPAGEVTFFDYYDANNTAQVLGTTRSGVSEQPERHILFGNDEVNNLIGYDNALGDRLYGGAGDDTLDGKAGNDYLEGGSGDDTYQFTGSWGKDTILDKGGQGHIEINGKPLAKIFGNGSSTWKSTLEDGTVVSLKLQDDARSSTGKMLVISKEGGSGNTITLKNFDLSQAQGDTGYLGIKLPGTEIALTETGTVSASADSGASFWSNLNAKLSDLAGKVSNFVSGTGRSFTIDLNQAAGAGDTLTLHVALDDSALAKAILGDRKLDASGAVITLEAGQTSVSFALVSDGDISADLSGSLSVSYASAEGQSATSNTWGLNLKDAGETQQTFSGDYAAMTVANEGDAVARITPDGGNVVVLDQGGAKFVWDSRGNLVADANGAMVTDNVIFGTLDNDHIMGLTGNDALGGGAGNDHIEGGEGDDLIGGGSGSDRIEGGAGNDYISSSAGLAPYSQQYGPNDTWNRWGLPGGKTAITMGATWGIYEESKDSPIWSGIGDTRTETTDGDSIDAGAGNDHVIASWGDDRVDGGDGDDGIDGLAGADVIDGGAGDDNLSGDGTTKAGYLNSVEASAHGADFIDGGLGNDQISGDGGADNLFGGEGADKIFGDSGVASSSEFFVDLAYHGADYIDGEEGDDYLEGNGGADTLYGGAGADTLKGDQDAERLSASQAADLANWGDDYLDGEDGDDLVWGNGGNDTLYGGAGNDQLVGDETGGALPAEAHGDDYLDGEDGDDTLVGGGKNDTLYGGAGDDHLIGDETEGALVADAHGDDYLDGEDGDDSLVGGGKDDTLYGGAGNDKLWGDESSPTLDGAAQGKDYLDGEDGDDQLVGGGADDTLIGGAGDDRLFGDDSLTKLAAEFHGADYLDGGAGNDYLEGGGGDDVLVGGAGNDTLRGGLGSNSLDAGDGNDFLEAESSANTLLGGAGDDQLNNTGGDNNYLDGGDGKDNLFTAGEGNTLTGGSGDDQLTIVSGSNNHLDGEDGDDLLFGKENGNTLLGGAGKDQLVIEQGSGNHLDGGEGDDRLYVLSGASGNTLDGGAGADQLLLDSGSGSVASGGDGDDVLEVRSADNTLLGGAGNDTLIARSGGNLLDGGDGQDWYAFSAGFGENHITDGGGGGNTVQFYFDYDGSGLALGVGSLKLSFANGDVLHIDGFDPDDPINTSTVNTFVFNDRTFTLEELLVIGSPDITGTPEADVLQGTPFRENIYGLAGDDVIDGGAGNDVLLGDDGNDMLHGGSGDDVLDGGTGIDTLVGGRGDDTYWIRDGEDVIVENAAEGTDQVLALVDYALSENVENLEVFGGSASRAIGNAQDNIIKVSSNEDAYVDGQAGDDTLTADQGHLIGGDGNDVLRTYRGNSLLEGGAGHDVLTTGGGNDVLIGGGGADRMDGGAGGDTYEVDDLGDEVVETIAGQSETDTVDASIAYTLGANLENLNLTGSSDIAGTGNSANNIIQGNDGANSLFGLDGNDRLNGGAGADELLGGAGSDILDGGSGADIMDGGLGNDEYFVDHEDDQVIEAYVGDSVTTMQWLWDGVRWNYQPVIQVTPNYEIVNSAVSFALGANLESLYLRGAADINGFGNELNNMIAGNEGVNLLSGGAGSDSLYGNGGNDELQGGDGADQLNGGSGDDLLKGGAGDDSYVVGEAGDQIVEFAGEGYDRVKSSIDYGLAEDLEALALTDGAVIGRGNELDNRIDGNANDNVLEGLGGDDDIDGGVGDDLISGGDGNDRILGGDDYPYDYEGPPRNNDTLLGEAGDDNIDGQSGNDIIGGGAGNDVLYGGGDGGNDGPAYLSNRDLIHGDEGGDSIDGGSDADTLYGGDGDDLIYGGDNSNRSSGYYDPETDSYVAMSNDDFADGGEGDDEIYGEAGNDTLLGGAGSDFIDGGSGNDALVGGEGSDLLIGGAGNDVIYGSHFGGTADAAQDEADSQSAPRPAVTLIVNSLEDDGAIPSANQLAVAQHYILQGENGDGPYATAVAGWTSWGMGYDYDFYSLGALTKGQAINASTDTYFDNVLGLYDSSGNLIAVSSATPGQTYGTESLLDYSISYTDTYYLSVSERSSWQLTDPFDASSGPYWGTWTAGSYSVALDITDAVKFQIDSGYLDAAVSIDEMEGGAGSDTYVVDGTYEKVEYFVLNDCGDAIPATRLEWTADSVFENAGEGYDVVMSSGSFALGDNIEELRLIIDPSTATTDPQYHADLQAYGQDGTGNDLDNVIIGNELNNRLDGGRGADRLQGGAGNDTYVVDAGDDEIIELADQGIDTVESYGDYSLAGTNLENLTLLEEAEWGAGNDADNILVGNQYDNWLEGYAGTDKLVGGAGNDWLAGGEGDDRYVFRKGDGYDTIVDWQGGDTLFFGSDLTRDDIYLYSDGDSLVLGIQETGEEVYIQDWFIQDEGVRRIEFCDGSALDRVGILAYFNEAPEAYDDGFETDEDAGQAVLATSDLLGNDWDPEAGVIQVVGFDAISEGGNSVTRDGQGNLVYAFGDRYQSLAAGQAFTDHFAYTMADEFGASSAARVELTVMGLNDAPVVQDDTAKVSEDDVLSAAGNVLVNDSDIDQGAVLNIAGAGTLQGSYGSLVLGDDGSYAYVLNNSLPEVQALAHGEVMTETFQYLASDGEAAVPATLTVTITGRNDGPAAVDDAVAVDEDQPLTVTAQTLLTNDTDVDTGDSRNLVGVDGASQLGATVTLDNGLVVYEQGGRFNSLRAGETIVDSYTYTMTDNQGATSTAKVSVTVTGVNDGPKAGSDAGLTGEDVAQTTLSVADLLANDTDADTGDVLILASVEGLSAQGNAISQDAQGNLVFDIGNRYQSLAAGETATDSFAYTVADSAGAVSAAMVAMTIAGANDGPIAQADADLVSEDGVLAATGNVLANDSDVDNGALLQVATPGSYTGLYGSLQLNADGSYSYALDNGSAAVQTLAQDTVVNDVFAYSTSDGMAEAASTLTISIAGANDAPTLVAPLADQTVTAGQLYSYQVAETSFTDVDAGDTLSYTAMLADGQVLPSWLQFDAATRVFTGTPAGVDVGQFSINLVATDPGGARAFDTFVIDVGASASEDDGCHRATGRKGDHAHEERGGKETHHGRGRADDQDTDEGSRSTTGGWGDPSHGVDSGCRAVDERCAKGMDTEVATGKHTAGASGTHLPFSEVCAINVIRTSDGFAIKERYRGEKYQVEQFKTVGGRYRLDGQVQNLVQAMAAFSPSAPGHTPPPDSYAATLNPVIAANWQ